MVSVIIPVYNAEPYLTRCLDSVLCSTYSDFELLLINDGSTDRSLEICMEYAQRDSRIRLFSQENQGVSAARNLGLEKCAGEWIAFVDADDMISPNLLELIAADDYSAKDLLLFDFAGTEEELFRSAQMSKIHSYDREYMAEILRCVLVPRQLVKKGHMNILSPWAKAYKKSIIDQYGIRFDTEIFHGEDRLFNLEYLLRAESCTYICHPVYFYYIHNDSATYRFSPGLPQNHAHLLEQIGGALENSHMLALLEKDYHSYALDNLTYVLVWGIFHPHNKQAYREKCTLCREMRENPVYQQALPYNRACGGLRRRILVFLFRLRWYRVINIISILSHKMLSYRQRH